MLRIIITETSAEQRFIVQGRLVQPWVDELKTAWDKALDYQNGRIRIIDLNDVAFVDEDGEELLRFFSKQGAKFVARGVYTKGLLQEVEQSA